METANGRLSLGERFQRGACEAVAAALGLTFDAAGTDASATLQRVQGEDNDAPQSDAGGVADVWAIAYFRDEETTPEGGAEPCRVKMTLAMDVEVHLQGGAPAIEGRAPSLAEWANGVKAQLVALVEGRGAGSLGVELQGLGLIDVRVENRYGPLVGDGEPVAGVEVRILRAEERGKPWG